MRLVILPPIKVSQGRERPPDRGGLSPKPADAKPLGVRRRDDLRFERMCPVTGNTETETVQQLFDPPREPNDPLIHDRRTQIGESSETATSDRPKGRRERRRRVDPTTFEKQYSQEELEFMNAMQRFKGQSGTDFPSHREVLMVLHELGYRRPDDRAGCQQREKLSSRSQDSH